MRATTSSGRSASRPGAARHARMRRRRGCKRSAAAAQTPQCGRGGAGSDSWPLRWQRQRSARSPRTSVIRVARAAAPRRSRRRVHAAAVTERGTNGAPRTLLRRSASPASRTLLCGAASSVSVFAMASITAVRSRKSARSASCARLTAIRAQWERHAHCLQYRVAARREGDTTAPPARRKWRRRARRARRGCEAVALNIPLRTVVAGRVRPAVIDRHQRGILILRHAHRLRHGCGTRSALRGSRRCMLAADRHNIIRLHMRMCGVRGPYESAGCV